MAPIICFLACHGASSDHFATFIQNTSSDQVKIHVYASPDMAKKFEDRKIAIHKLFVLNSSQDAEAIAKECATALVVITDVGHQFSATIQQALQEHAPKTYRIAYYDNPETFVPGGYSETAKSVMQVAQAVLFANANLATQTLYSAPNIEVDLTEQKKIGLGYYPIAQAEAIAEQRATRQVEERAKLFAACDVKDTGQKVTVYFGGNNEEYFEKAFPAFLSLLDEAAKNADLSSHLFVLHQHPAAKKSNRDAAQIVALKNARIFISTVGSDLAQIFADRAMYYQTSMGPQFVLAGIPTCQIGHERYEDVLVRSKLIDSITTSEQLLYSLSSPQSQNIERAELLSSLGINPKWPQVLSAVYKMSL